MSYHSDLDLSTRFPDRVPAPKPRGYRRLTRQQHIQKMQWYKRTRYRGQAKKRENAAAGEGFVKNKVNVPQNAQAFAAADAARTLLWVNGKLIYLPQGNDHETENQGIPAPRLLHLVPVG